MHAMQYSFSFSDDYDMDAIRSRVAEKGPGFDGLPGLGLKAFLITDVKAGAAVNTYAPYYIWLNQEAMIAFLSGELFAGVSAAFGRPAVRRPLTIMADVVTGAARPRAASIERIPVDPDSVWHALEREARRYRAALDAPGLFAMALTLDTEAWEFERFGLWEDTQAALSATQAARLFEVLHLSVPALDAPPGD